jgi:cellulose synthase/poly-beta-1,6-N-acetylglucosamine synthase-like glycosyltransferase
VLSSGGRGPGAARNLGWRATERDLVWFVDADCVPEPDSLRFLVERLDADPALAAAGGSYSNLLPGSLLACTIHEEIVARHTRMGSETDHLGTFNALFRRATLLESGGFDEHRYNGPGHAAAEDLELSLRLRSSGRRLGFVRESRVGHHHPTSLARYLRSQSVHGFYATRVYLDHPTRHGRSEYSGWLDHVQPPIALLTAAAALLAPFVRLTGALALVGLVLQFSSALPMALPASGFSRP